MEKERPGVMLYFDILPALEKMDASDAGRLFVAVLRYAQSGIEPELEGAADLVWSFIKSSLDRDALRYRDIQLQAQWKVYCREEKKRGREPLRFGDWMLKEKLSFDNIGYQQITGDSYDGVCYPTPTPTPSPTPTVVPSATLPSPAEKPKYTGYGQYGWVKLTDEQYKKLLSDLGETELKRCIAYVDEAAQSTGNKNRWKDWNLVIRRCHRDRWGVGKEQATQKPYVYDPGDTTGSL